MHIIVCGHFDVSWDIDDVSNKKISQISRVTIFNFFSSQTKQQIFAIPSSFSELMSARIFFVLFHLTKWKYFFSGACMPRSEMVDDKKQTEALCIEKKCQRQLFFISRDGLTVDNQIFFFLPRSSRLCDLFSLLAIVRMYSGREECFNMEIFFVAVLEIQIKWNEG